jgi:Mg-chelatase subunit ChlD
MYVLAALRRDLRVVVMHQKSRVENVFLASASESSQRDARIGENHVIFYDFLRAAYRRHIAETRWRRQRFRLSRRSISRAPAA